ncbi:hypothetical protein NE865_16058 [Phthorimaea operculella]|nr:hypothetical protein NE865_16058 [Phthorimaea operculella]
MGGNMIENGLWEVKAVEDCENADQFDFQVQVERRKLNRTHDMFNAIMNFKADLDDNFGVKIKICKWVDGGCKDYSTITDENIVDFLTKMAEDNLKAAMELIGIEPTFPVATGEYECENFLIDYCEFPCKSVLGLFDAEVILLNRNQDPVSCLIATVEFREAEGDEELCAKCQEEDDE